MLPHLDSPSATSQLLKKLRSFSSLSPSPTDHPSKHPTTTPLRSLLSPRLRLLLILSVLLLQLLLLLSARSLPSRRLHLRRHPSSPPPSSSSQCDNSRIYVYDLPPAFNHHLVAACDDLNPWSSRCAALSNSGFGLPATDLAGLIPSPLLPSFYATDQFAAELIFHRRILSHPCRTSDPSAASAFFVPFYAGLAVGRLLWSPTASAADRDRDCAALLRFLADQHPYRRSGGADHFMVLGRITWDFRRSRDIDWGSSLLYMPGMQNVTRLLIERNPWDHRDVAVPYPTGFHPRSAGELRSWQKFVLDHPRPALFSFAGAARAKVKGDFRGLLLDECSRAGPAVCKAVDCGGGRCGGNRSAETTSLFLGSRFCLQPRGDSFTRRSMFDCMVAGAIPVLFWRRSAHAQYEWYLPDVGAGEEGEWSVFVNRTEVRSGAASVRAALEGIGAERVRRMRERVVEMIPRLVYAAAEEGLGDGVADAFDVAVDGVLRRFREERRRRRRGGEHRQ